MNKITLQPKSPRTLFTPHTILDIRQNFVVANSLLLLLIFKLLLTINLINITTSIAHILIKL